MLTVGSCFSGIGGLELGLEWTGGFETKWQIEIDPYATKVLEKHWPNVKRYSDITKVRGEELERVDVICGGYPCQPFALSGRRGGKEDTRHLWPEMFRLICGIRPRFALMENVAGHLSLGFDRVLADLSSIGFNAEWQMFCASDVGLPHRRERIFIVAYPNGVDGKEGVGYFHNGTREIFKESDFKRHAVRIQAADKFIGMDDGVRGGVYRLRGQAVGNAVVPQVAQKIGEMILSMQENPK